MTAIEKLTSKNPLYWVIFGRKQDNQNLFYALPVA